MRTFQNIRLFPRWRCWRPDRRPAQRAARLEVLIAGIFKLPGYRQAGGRRSNARRCAIDASIHLADDAAGDLPYGIQRRIEIARALCVDPVLLCLDRPPPASAPRESAELNELLLYLLRPEMGIAILLIRHDMSVVMNVSTIGVISYGRKIAEAHAGAGQARPWVIKAYLGGRGRRSDWRAAA